jgi:hypothetical protein
MVKSLHPCSFNSQAFSHPTLLKTSSNSESIPIVWRKARLKAGVWVNSRSFNSQKIFFLQSSWSLICLSLRRVHVSSGAEREDNSTTGDEGSTSILEPARDEEWLLDERNATALLTLPMNLLILPTKTNTRQKQLLEMG